MVEPLFERAALVCPVLVIIRRRYRRTDRRQVWRLCQRGQHLRRAYVRPAEHSHFSVCVRQRARPLDRVVPVFSFMLERIPFTFRLVPPAHVLHDYDISACCCNVCKRGDPRLRFVVGRPRQQYRQLFVRLRPVDIRPQRHAIPHFHGHVVFDCEFIRFLRLRRQRARCHQNRCGDFQK